MFKYEYVLFNLDTNMYLTQDHLLTKNYKEGASFMSKDDAVVYFKQNAKEISELGRDWTTREFFNED